MKLPSVNEGRLNSPAPGDHNSPPHRPTQSRCSVPQRYSSVHRQSTENHHSVTCNPEKSKNLIQFITGNIF